MSPSKQAVISAIFAITLASLIHCICSDDDNWWKHAVVYQIYPRSFKDSNNDGIGDLKGITSKLEHLKNAGVTAAWLSPIYKSPQVDQGYDISDFRDIDPEYGTLEDFKELLKKAHELGLKIIMDFVPNHTSNEHVWFKLSENRTEGYEDFYVWANPNETTGKEPNNWVSHFQDTVWQWSNIRKQYYLHQFTIEQPDLNYRNPLVVKEMTEILKYWLDMGVDGFRVDAIPYLVEDIRLLDEPLSGRNVPNNSYQYLDHIYTSDQDETYDLVCKMREFFDHYNKVRGGPERIFMTEAYTTMKNTMRYYRNMKSECEGAYFSFNFFLITELNEKSTARDIVRVIKEWQDNLLWYYPSNWILGNHDKSRVATRFGPKNVDGFNMLTMLLPGITITYNGEEIGQEDGEVTFEEGKDPNGCKSTKLFPEISRDFERTPFQWDDTVNAGFNDGAKPWLPVSKKYHQNNLAAQSVVGTKSHFNIYKSLTKIRQLDPFKDDHMTIKALTDNTLALGRFGIHQSYVLVFNKGDQKEIVDLSKSFPFLPTSLEVVLVSVDSSKIIGKTIDAESITVDAHESILLIGIKTMSSGSIPKNIPTNYLVFLLIFTSLLCHYVNLIRNYSCC